VKAEHHADTQNLVSNRPIKNRRRQSHHHHGPATGWQIHNDILSNYSLLPARTDVGALISRHWSKSSNPISGLFDASFFYITYFQSSAYFGREFLSHLIYKN